MERDIIKYFKTLTIYKKKNSDEIVSESTGYAMAESKEEHMKTIELVNSMDSVFIALNMKYDIEHIITECSKEEYENNRNKKNEELVDLSRSKSEVN